MGNAKTGQISVNKQAILSQILADSGQYLRSQSNNSRRTTNQNQMNGGKMGDDITAAAPVVAANPAAVSPIIANPVAAGSDERQKIEARLKEISGYKFIPPSIKEEKERLEQKLSALGGGADGDTDKDAVIDTDKGAGGNSWVATADKVTDFSSPQLNKLPEIKPQEADDKGFGFTSDSAPKAEEPAKKSNPTSSWDFPTEDEVNQEYAPPKEESIKPEPVKAREADEPKSSHQSAGNQESINKAKHLIDSLKKAVEEAVDNPDGEYLKEVIDLFVKAVKGLEERAHKVEMTAEQRAKAISSRLALYVKNVKAEFEFSGLLNEELREKVKKLG